MIARKPNSPTPPLRGSIAWLLSLAGLGLLPMVPELTLCLRGGSGLKSFGPIGYYEFIISFLLLVPALFLNRTWSRGWVLVVGVAMGVTTLIAGWQVFTVGARWDITAHGALMQTSPGEAWGYLRAFISGTDLARMTLLVAGFVSCLVVNWRATMPSRRAAVGSLVAGLLAGSYGLHNAVRYGGWPVHDVQVANGSTLRIADMGINKCHPLTLVLITHRNYRVTHAYYLAAFKKTSDHAARFEGARVVPDATVPRIVLVVLGESAGRGHWSLYGYERETNPRLAALGDEVLLFSDVISASVGTQTVLRSMFTTDFHSLPVFPLFAAAGYKTYWFSAQYNQGAHDVEIAALVQSAGDRVFLNGAYDEDLLPFVRRVVAAPGQHIIFLNLFGSHVRYDDRYPARFDFFRGEDDKSHRLAAYDNSIRYTDHILAELVAMLRAEGGANCLLYVSDHAEDVYDSNPDVYLFRSDAVATNPMYEVPFLVWFSSAYRQGNPAFIAAVVAARDRPYQTLHLYDSIIDLARFTHPLHDPRRSVFSAAFEPKVRRVGAMARIYGK